MAITKTVSAQWDIGYSAFSLGGAALSLMKAAIVDDIQPAAIYAAEALGSIMLVDPKLDRQGSRCSGWGPVISIGESQASDRPQFLEV